MSRVATVYSEAFPGSGGPLACQLVVVEGPDRGRAIRLGARPLVVGTAAGCDLVLTDERVSARHLEVREDGGRFAVRDLGSTNGTLYEGSAIAEATLAPGAGVKIGRTFVRFQPTPRALDLPPSQARRFGELVGESLAMRELFAVLERAAASDVTVLLEGETGTGKELAARALHERGPRRAGPFVAVDCGALPEGLLDSELFGHVRGAFTGASGPRAGLFARADGGTLFLDELDGIPPATQARLLRALEERAVRPVGADDARTVDVRVVAACHGSLERRVAEGGFRADLYYRISVLTVALPPLRARREDLAILVTELLRRRGVEAGAIEGAGLDALIAHGWPGNVRELRNVIDRAVALAPGARGFGELPIAIAGGVGAARSDDELAVRADLPFADAKQAIVHAFERRYLRDAFARAGGNVTQLARETGLDRKHARTLLRKHGLLDGGEED
jgi:two-component system, NtrC family, response regulator HydG